MFRFVIFAAVVVGVALVAPQVAPTIFATWLHPAETGEGGDTRPSEPAVAVEQASETEVAPPPRPPRPAGRTVAIDADPTGHFVVDARVNGRSVSALVDTGATTVALTDETARQLGIIPPRDRYTRPVETANGIVQAAPIVLGEVDVGGILIRNVHAIVVPGDNLSINLLGMSYLNRLERFESADGRLTLIE